MHRIGIVGGGASGVLVAIQLLRRTVRPLEIELVEPAERLGAGAAYGTPDPRHLLNVRAGGMSALPEEPDHFRAWAGCDPDAYLPRQDYARYLRELLEACAREASSTVHHRRDTVTDVLMEDGRYRLQLASGERLDVDAAVLATGNALPRLPEQIALESAAIARLAPDPWTLEPGASGRSLIIGSGLTAVDVASSLLADDPSHQVVCISRHGLLPRSHDNPWITPAKVAVVTPEDVASGLSLRAMVHALATSGPRWRQQVDALRPRSQELWRSLSLDQRAQFLRHVERYWEVHRHRMAPEVVERLERWQAEGRLRVCAADVTSITSESDGVVARAADGREWRADRVIAATGPASPVRGDGLLAELVAHGRVRIDPLGLGLDIAPDTYEAYAPDGRRHRGLHVIGPATKGTLWESTAVPDIRAAAAVIAQSIAGA